MPLDFSADFPSIHTLYQAIVSKDHDYALEHSSQVLNLTLLTERVPMSGTHHYAKSYSKDETHSRGTAKPSEPNQREFDSSIRSMEYQPCR